MGKVSAPMYSKTEFETGDPVLHAVRLMIESNAIIALTVVSINTLSINCMSVTGI